MKLDKVKGVVGMLESKGCVNSKEVLVNYIERYYGWDGKVKFCFDKEEDECGVVEYVDDTGCIMLDIIMGNSQYNIFNGYGCKDIDVERKDYLLDLIYNW